MSVFKETSLNRGISGIFDEVAAEQGQIMWFRLDGSTGTLISAIYAGYLPTDLALAAPVTDLSPTYIRGRLVIFFGDVDFTHVAPNELLLTFSPFGTNGQSSIPGRKLFDGNVVNQRDFIFVPPIGIPQGQVCNIVLSAGYRFTDAGILNFQNDAGFLSVMGGYEAYGNAPQKAFPFDLR